MTHQSFTHATPATWSDLDKDQRVAAIRALAGLGHTSTQIAATLSTTRHAVHGAAHRARITISERVQRPRVDLPVEPPVSEDNWLPLGKPVTMLARTDEQCAWPVGPDRDRTCCGGEVHKKDLCRDHYKKAYCPAGPIAPVVERPSLQPSVNRHDRRALMHGGKAQHFEGAE